jgi:hypothetical protein
MTNPAIKAARKAAGEAARKAMLKPSSCMVGTSCEFPPCQCAQVIADDAVEVFLRALPSGGWSFNGCHITAPHMAAAAVARAAKEDSA